VGKKFFGLGKTTLRTTLAEEISLFSGFLDSCMVKKTIPHPDKDVFKASEACGHLGLCWNTVKKLIKEGEISPTEIKQGRRVRYLFTRENLNEYLRHNDDLDEAFLQSRRRYG
jgi:excisionase family DNA binding protein